MIKMFGPKNSRDAYTGSFIPHEDLVFFVEATTLKEAIDIYSVEFNVNIKQCESEPGIEEGKYFWQVDLDSNTLIPKRLLDIHVYRGEENICVKQDLCFNLQDGDIIEMLSNRIC